MNETVLLDTEFAREFARMLRSWTDNPNACDHCNHGDHATCDRWNRDVCQCPHPIPKETP